jgi:hypothetical protein
VRDPLGFGMSLVAANEQPGEQSPRVDRKRKTPDSAGVFSLLGYLDSNQEQLNQN